MKKNIHEIKLFDHIVYSLSEIVDDVNVFYLIEFSKYSKYFLFVYD